MSRRYYSAEEGGPRRALIVLDGKHPMEVFGAMAAISRQPFYRDDPKACWERFLADGLVE